MIPVLTLKAGKDQSARRFHPWIFSGAVASPVHDLQDGDVVQVCDAQGQALGTGHFQTGSIMVRLFSFEAVVPDQTFWAEKLREALASRQRLGLPSPDTNAYRLVHGEGDCLPGLIVDMYADTAVVQAHSAGMQRDRYHLAAALRAVLGTAVRGIYFRAPADPEGAAAGEWLLGQADGLVTIREHGLRFEVDVMGGQKTGFFLDQRQNRLLLGQLARGRRVLNTFAYTGGFSMYALHGGATAVDSVDVSARAVAQADHHAALNGVADRHRSFGQDVFQFLQRCPDDYDLIVLDPPAFAKHKSARHRALKGYQRLNAEALQRLRPGGLLFTFSCSQVVSAELFYNAVVAAAIQSRRSLRVWHRLTQPADHPVSIFHPEGEYLKGLVLEVS